MEEEMRMTEKGQGDAGSSEEESGVDVANNSPTKRGRGRPKGSKKLQVWVTDVNLELGSEISNGGSTQTVRGRGSPKGKKNTAQQSEQESGDDNAPDTPQPQRGRGRPKGSGSKKQASNEDGSTADHSPKKRGRPKGSSNKKTPNKPIASEDESGADLSNGGPISPKKGRGRPKGSNSVKRKSESGMSEGEDDGSSSPPRKRGRPKGSPNKKTQLMKLKEMSGEGDVTHSEDSTEDFTNGISSPSQRGRGRPRKAVKTSGSSNATDGSQTPKRGRGRPKGSLNKKYPFKVRGTLGRPRKVDSIKTEVVVSSAPRRKRGRPRKDPNHTSKRGRPRKHPLPSPEELKKPKVWKPLGRPRKYPRVDPPEGAAPTPRRGRGRPRKSESKKGAHFRKHMAVTTTSSPRSPSDGTPRKRGRPSGTVKGGDDAPRRRGRPKGSVKKYKAAGELESGKSSRHAKVKEDSSAEQEEYEEQVEEELEQDGETVPEEDAEEESLIDQNRSFGQLEDNDLAGSTEAAMN